MTVNSWKCFLASASPVQHFFRFSMLSVYNFISSSSWAVVAQLGSVCGRTIEVSVA